MYVIIVDVDVIGLRSAKDMDVAYLADNVEWRDGSWGTERSRI